MSDVSCRVFLIHEEAWVKDGQSVDELVEGVSLSLEHLRNRHERFDWESYQQILRNMAKKWTPEQFEAIGRANWTFAGFRVFAIMGRLMFSARDFYVLGHQNGKGIASQLFSCVSYRTTDMGENRLRIEFRLKPGYKAEPAYFHIGRGTLEDATLVLALPRAKVDLTISDTVGVYDIEYPSGGGALSWLRKAVSWPATLFSAGQELREAYATLQERYEELQEYKVNLDQRVKERTAELAAAKDELSATVVQLREAQAIRDRFFSNVNHEIRTPLSLISIGVDDVLARYETQLDDRARSSLELSLDGVQNLVGLVDELLLLAAGQEGKLTLQRSRYDLVDSAKRSVHAWSTLAADAGNDLVYSGPESLSGTFDRAALDRVLNNLLSNAIKFCRDGRITVSVSEDEDYAILRVQDEGPGVSDELKERIFDRFEQGEAGASSSRGSGIGLSIVKELAELHDGSVRVLDGETRGAVFELRLPLKPAPGSEQVVEGGSFVSTPVSRTPRRQAEERIFAQTNDANAPLILIAEDEHDLRTLVAAALAHNGFRVAAAENGAVALELALKLRPDLLITDVNMPEMNGYELIEALRDEPGTGFLPIVILSAYGGTRDVVTGLDRGAIDYVRKPVQIEELVSRVDAQLRWREMAIKLNEQEKLSSLATLSVGLAHELRNPANVLVNGLSLLGDRLELPEGSSSRALMDAVNEAGKHLAEVSKHLLGLDTRSAPASHVSVTEIVARAERIVADKLQTVKYQRSLPPCATNGQAALLAQVFVNLLDNAVQACGQGGTVELTTDFKDGQIVIHVQDSGPGVPQELKRKIFEPFFTTKQAGEGTGLGLATAKRIVLDVGGDLYVASTTPSIIAVSLPQDTMTLSRPPVSSAASASSAM
ncbi:MAG: ATP-binding protein [Myxococcota bacterium]